MQQVPSVLTMGFSPAAAVATWRLSNSNMYQCMTYWPVETVVFDSEVFGAQQVYRPQHFDLGSAKAPGGFFNVVILVIPTIKDVARMCKRLQSVVNKNTLVLVDVSGGIAPLQRLVRSNLDSSIQVSGLICDIDAEFANKVGKVWTIIHRKIPSGMGNSSAKIVTVEPNSGLNKSITSLTTAWSATGIPATFSKSLSAFGEIQWQRTIAVVAFELLTVLLDTPEPEKLSSSLIAKPIIEGVIGELNMIAAASGIKGLPSKSQMMSRGSKLARRAPSTFSIPGASRCYYDTFRRTPVALDFLVLLPILLSDELPKGGATPYLESLYAYMSRLMELNVNEYQSALFQRVDLASTDGASSTNADTPEFRARVSEIEALEARLIKRENEVKQSESDFASRESTIKARESRYDQILEDLRLQQEQQKAKAAELDSQAAQNQRRLQSFEELNDRSEKLRMREESFSELERKMGLKDRGLRQRELELITREQGLIARESELVNRSAASGALRSYTVEEAKTPTMGSPPLQNPTTPGGTVYSRFDPRAPAMVGPTQTSTTQSANTVVPGGTPSMQNGQFQGIGSVTMAMGSRPRHSQSNITITGMNGNMNGNMLGGYGPNDSMISRPASRTQLSSQSYTGSSVPIVNGTSQQQQRRRSSRHVSVDEPEMAPGRRRQQSMPNNLYMAPAPNTFSQNFQLDGVMGSTTDRYHFVSRARNKQRDAKLSSDEEAYNAKRKFLHGNNTANPAIASAGGGVSTGSAQGGMGPTSNYAGSVNNMSLDDAAGPRGFHPGDLSGIGGGSYPMQRRSVGAGINKMVTSPTARSLLPSTLVNSGSEFGGFSFADNMDGAMTSGGSTGSHNHSSSGSNGTLSRSRTGTPPTPQGTMDPSVLLPGQKWSVPDATPFHLS